MPHDTTIARSDRQTRDRGAESLATQTARTACRDSRITASIRQRPSGQVGDFGSPPTTHRLPSARQYDASRTFVSPVSTWSSRRGPSGEWNEASAVAVPAGAAASAVKSTSSSNGLTVAAVGCTAAGRIGQRRVEIAPSRAPAIGACSTAGSGDGSPTTTSQSREWLTAIVGATDRPSRRSAALPSEIVCSGSPGFTAEPGGARRCVRSDHSPSDWQSSTSVPESMQPITTGVGRRGPIPPAGGGATAVLPGGTTAVLPGGTTAVLPGGETAVQRLVASKGSTATTPCRSSSMT